MALLNNGFLTGSKQLSQTACRSSYTTNSRPLPRSLTARGGAAAVTRRALLLGMATASTASASETKKKYELVSAGKGTYKTEGIGGYLNLATSSVYPFVRFGSAAFVSGNLSEFRKRPSKPIELYEFQACPFCTKVREAVTLLDIDALFYPCPKGGPTWRPKAQAESGKSQFPYMVDPNTGKKLLESDAIVEYLWNEYGDGKVPTLLKLGPLTTITIGLGLLPRGTRGINYRKSRLPQKPLDIWGYEASPFVRLTREVLNELELPHVYHSVGRNSPKRTELREKWDTFQVPYLEDPNTGKALFESGEINSYLEKTYAV